MYENIVKLNKYVARNYQLPLCDAIENKGYKRVIGILPRRSGKDLTAWNLCIRQCLKKTCLVYYCLPTYSQAKKTVWDAISIDGTKFIDFIPKELIASINSQEMKIRFTNDSLLQLIGSDTYDTSLVGTNPYAIIFSEAALMDPKAYQFARPILAANDGWCMLISTPRGRNWLWELYVKAQKLPDWFTYKLTVSDTKHVSAEILETERQQTSEELHQQEWYTSFDRGVEGSFYAKYLDKIRSNNQVGIVPWDSSLRVNVSFDIGVADATCLIFFQITKTGAINIIDSYSNTNVGLDHYVKLMQSKPYTYGVYLGPPDLRVREWAGGAITRLEKARQLGIDFTIVPMLTIDDGIEAVWTNFNRFYIDEAKCRDLIHALENYRREWDEAKNVYKDRPVHDHHSNWADSLRYACIGLHLVSQDITAEELDRRYNQVRYGSQAFGPNSVFNTRK